MPFFNKNKKTFGVMKNKFTKIPVLIMFAILTATSCQTQKDFTKTQKQLNNLKENNDYNCHKDKIKAAEELYKEAEDLKSKGESDKAEIKIMAANEIISEIKKEKCPQKETTEQKNDNKPNKDEISPIEENEIETTEIKDPANEDLNIQVVGNYKPEPVYFAFNSYSISEETKKILLKHLEYLLNHPQVKVIIGGHTDSRGSEEYNLILGEKRANVVKNFFINQGINKDRIKVISYGEEIPAVEGNTEEAYAKNRRDEFKFILEE